MKSRSLTGAWIETAESLVISPNAPVAPLRGRGLKPKKQRHRRKTARVAPLRGRGLKLQSKNAGAQRCSRSLTGAWIETVKMNNIIPINDVAPLRGRGLKLASTAMRGMRASRSLTGAWIETKPIMTKRPVGRVAPLRGRGLKHNVIRNYRRNGKSLPYGGVD